MSNNKSMNNLYGLTTNSAIEMFSRQQRMLESIDFASIVASNSALATINSMPNYSEMISNSVSQMANISQSITQSIAQSIVPITSSLEQFKNISEIMNNNYSELLANISLSTQGILGNLQQSLSGVLPELASNASYMSILSNKGIMEAYSQSISNMVESIRTPMMNISDIIENLNWWHDIDFRNFDIDEDEQEEIIEETESAIRGVFSDISEVNSLESLNVEDKNWEQKWMETWTTYKEKHPVVAYCLGKFFDTLILTLIITPMVLACKSYVIESFAKTKDVSNNFNISDAKKEVKKTVNQDYYPIKDGVLNLYRYINEDNVFIRESHTMKGHKIVGLNRGDIIEVQYKDSSKKRSKNWIYVEYEDENGFTHRGWINNLYTKKININQ